MITKITEYIEYGVSFASELFLQEIEMNNVELKTINFFFDWIKM